ncbi:hypothetical protein [Shewanella sp. Isolate7]|uniref:hypothetical protein n=1 Tax=Shewanella sp. Isolate7 TaxID=2908528 RepID=UPI001EFC40F6|nr:hypothetical protein [Shewanella sp. Isolate7]MCG9722134.1 hypothetical protein [Shewanella sp. Isolate7]
MKTKSKPKPKPKPKPRRKRLSHQEELLVYVMLWVASPRTSQEHRKELATDWLNKNCPNWQQSKGGSSNAN